MAWKFAEYSRDWSKISRAAKKRAGGRCESCGTMKGPLHAHHVVPASKGGSDTLGNLRVLCESCHAKLHPHMRHLLRSHSQSSTMTDWHPRYWQGASVYEEERAKTAERTRQMRDRAEVAQKEEERRFKIALIVVAILVFVFFKSAC